MGAERLVRLLGVCRLMPRNSKITAADLPPKLRSELLGNTKYQKRHKYGVASREDRTDCDGVVFQSTREMERHGELKMLAATGQITRLKRQVPYRLHATGGETITTYLADFVYLEGAIIVVEDSKGKRTDMYLLKKKWMKAEYGIEIKET